MERMNPNCDMLRISSAGLLLTYWCNARCGHCYLSCSPDRTSWMNVEDARRHFQALARLGLDPSGVHIGGGEPFGNYPLLLEVVRAAGEAGLGGVGYVETNGYWATDAEVVRRRLGELGEAGMQRISISADVFHQEFVDPQRVTLLWQAALEVLGQGGLRARRWQFLKSPTDLRSASATARRAAYAEALSRHDERMTGRAAAELSGLVERFPAETFREQNCAAGLRDSGHLHIDPSGYIFPGTCAGLLLGKACCGRSADEVLAAPRGPLWRLLVEGGPGALLGEALQLGYRQADGGYADKCHLCTSLRAFLLNENRFPDEIGPAALYDSR
ncbi:MAG: radical SAM protein [Anaerolineaceae bacterium]|nr:radical SAM protein [Anaerolineaceae bacterium]